MKHTLNLIIVVSVFFVADLAYGQLNREKPAILEDVGVEEKLGDYIPMDLTFATSEGDSVTIAELMEDGKPVLLNPLYYDCPTLCGIVLDAVFNVVHDLAWSPGSEYTIISYSIDPKETSELAAESKAEIMADLERRGADEGWHFLTGSEEAITALSEAVGFKYKYDEKTGEYLHLASIMMISPEGKITRYLYGLNMSEFDLRNALYEAADGKIGSTLERAVLYCFTYDPSSQSYVPVAVNIMKLGGLATMLILGIFLTILWRRNSGSSQPPKIEFQK
ncbi:SCO family protein [Rhodohalobacter sp. SW132]|uniref:SCO family protein n=1 Tax=Rhodohalobacter sp. SW132 TaxID=2293433 RepID=UPI000E244041|nr:SCO family protein [Rhodohalobacter sp. SW132]REL33146.1 SCO family protein [Rhodohalobacter sp. SW132]